MTSDDLKALSDAAKPGSWQPDGQFGETITFSDSEAIASLRKKINAWTLCALVNAYRSGELAHRDDLERTSTKELDALISEGSE